VGELRDYERFAENENDNESPKVFRDTKILVRGNNGNGEGRFTLRSLNPKTGEIGNEIIEQKNESQTRTLVEPKKDLQKLLNYRDIYKLKKRYTDYFRKNTFVNEKKYYDDKASLKNIVEEYPFFYLRNETYYTLDYLGHIYVEEKNKNSEDIYRANPMYEYTPEYRRKLMSVIPTLSEEQIDELSKENIEDRDDHFRNIFDEYVNLENAILLFNREVVLLRIFLFAIDLNEEVNKNTNTGEFKKLVEKISRQEKSLYEDMEIFFSSSSGKLSDDNLKYILSEIKEGIDKDETYIYLYLFLKLQLFDEIKNTPGDFNKNKVKNIMNSLNNSINDFEDSVSERTKKIILNQLEKDVAALKLVVRRNTNISNTERKRLRKEQEEKLKEEKEENNNNNNNNNNNEKKKREYEALVAKQEQYEESIKKFSNALKNKLISMEEFLLMNNEIRRNTVRKLNLLKKYEREIKNYNENKLKNLINKDYDEIGKILSEKELNRTKKFTYSQEFIDLLPEKYKERKNENSKKLIYAHDYYYSYLKGLEKSSEDKIKSLLKRIDDITDKRTQSKLGQLKQIVRHLKKQLKEQENKAPEENKNKIEKLIESKHKEISAIQSSKNYTSYLEKVKPLQESINKLKTESKEKTKKDLEEFLEKNYMKKIITKKYIDDELNTILRDLPNTLEKIKEEIKNANIEINSDNNKIDFTDRILKIKEIMILRNLLPQGLQDSIIDDESKLINKDLSELDNIKEKHNLFQKFYAHIMQKKKKKMTQKNYNNMKNDLDDFLKLSISEMKNKYPFLDIKKKIIKEYANKNYFI